MLTVGIVVVFWQVCCNIWPKSLGMFFLSKSVFGYFCGFPHNGLPFPELFFRASKTVFFLSMVRPLKKNFLRLPLAVSTDIVKIWNCRRYRVHLRQPCEAPRITKISPEPSSTRWVHHLNHLNHDPHMVGSRDPQPNYSVYKKTNHWPIFYKLWRSLFDFEKYSSNRKPAIACNPYKIGSYCKWTTSSGMYVLPVRHHKFSEDRMVGRVAGPNQGVLDYSFILSDFWFFSVEPVNIKCFILKLKWTC